MAPPGRQPKARGHLVPLWHQCGKLITGPPARPQAARRKASMVEGLTRPHGRVGRES